MIFVFGSNEAGIHGAGAAKHALDFEGAVRGQGWGLAGNSFAIPTKDKRIKSLPLDRVFIYALHFLTFARRNPNLQFKLTCIGCGLAGFRHDQIAPMFADAPDNCHFDTAWRPWLGEGRHYWGAFEPPAPKAKPGVEEIFTIARKSK